MARLTVKDAPTATRKLTKRATYVRRELSDLSKQEEQGTQGAAEARQRLADTFASDAQQAEHLTEATAQAADRFDHVTLALRHGTTTSTDPLARLAAAAARYGLPEARVDALKELAAHAAQRAREAAQRAQDKLDRHADDIAATLTLGEMTERLAKCGWDTKHSSVSRLRSSYLHHTQAWGRQRKSR